MGYITSQTHNSEDASSIIGNVNYYKCRMCSTHTPEDKGVWAYIFGALSYSSDYGRGPSKVEKKWG